MDPGWLAALAVVAVVGVLALGGQIEILPTGIKVKIDQGFVQNLVRARESKSLPHNATATAPPTTESAAPVAVGAASPADAPEVQEVARLSRALPRRLPRASLLWVDDRPLNNLFERRAFANLGIFADPYTTNADARAALARAPYDLVISDIGRGRAAETGWDLLEEVRDRDLPFVFYTSGADPDIQARAAAAGAAVAESPTELVSVVLGRLASGAGASRRRQPPQDVPG